MHVDALPTHAAWRHTGARDGFEVLFAAETHDGHTLSGHTTAAEDDVAWSVSYTVATDKHWQTTTVDATSHTANGTVRARLERSPDNHWVVDGVPRPDLEGCVDVDFESSAITNTLPVHRLDFSIGRTLTVPAAFVRAASLEVERLEQTYTRLDDTGRFAYTSTTFDFACDLTFDRSGLIVNYPSIAARVR